MSEATTDVWLVLVGPLPESSPKFTKDIARALGKTAMETSPILKKPHLARVLGRFGDRAQADALASELEQLGLSVVLERKSTLEDFVQRAVLVDRCAIGPLEISFGTADDRRWDFTAENPPRVFLGKFDEQRTGSSIQLPHYKVNPVAHQVGLGFVTKGEESHDFSRQSRISFGLIEVGDELLVFTTKKLALNEPTRGEPLSRGEAFLRATAQLTEIAPTFVDRSLEVVGLRLGLDLDGSQPPAIINGALQCFRQWNALSVKPIETPLELELEEKQTMAEAYTDAASSNQPAGLAALTDIPTEVPLELVREVQQPSEKRTISAAPADAASPNQPEGPAASKPLQRALACRYCETPIASSQEHFLIQNAAWCTSCAGRDYPSHLTRSGRSRHMMMTLVALTGSFSLMIASVAFLGTRLSILPAVATVYLFYLFVIKHSRATEHVCHIRDGREAPIPGMVSDLVFFIRNSPIRFGVVMGAFLLVIISLSLATKDPSNFSKLKKGESLKEDSFTLTYLESQRAAGRFSEENNRSKRNRSLSTKDIKRTLRRQNRFGDDMLFNLGFAGETTSIRIPGRLFGKIITTYGVKWRLVERAQPRKPRWVKIERIGPLPAPADVPPTPLDPLPINESARLAVGETRLFIGNTGTIKDDTHVVTFELQHNGDLVLTWENGLEYINTLDLLDKNATYKGRYIDIRVTKYDDGLPPKWIEILVK